MTYYLKYRPQTINDLDLKEVRESLKKIVKSKSVPHAFLFSGPKGTGKTSAARIMAKVVNCESSSIHLRGKGKVEPCNRCKQCLSINKGGNIDVIEIDAASHRGIDDVRNLREAVKLATASAKKKIYIIDEAHMLTTEASNALLKTLEEPPDHAIFILATTNPEKLIETIRSRAVNIKFNKANQDELLRSLNKVVRGEKLKIDKQSLGVVAKASDGSFRDATKILEQLATDKKRLTLKVVEEYLYGRGEQVVDDMIYHILNKDTKKVLNDVENIFKSGGSMKNLISSLIEKFREALLAKVNSESQYLLSKEQQMFSKDDLISLIDLFSEAAGKLSTAVVEQVPIELAIIDWCDRENVDKGDNTDRGDSDKKSVQTSKQIKVEEQLKAQKVKRKLNDTSRNRESNTPTPSNRLVDIDDGVWSKILRLIRPKNTSTEALLRAAKPVDYDGKTLTLGVYYSFHKERLESSQHRNILEDTLMQIVGSPTRVNCVLTRQEVKSKVTDEDRVVLEEDKDEDIVKIAEEIFGS
jgi:DNA polymerase-3 subunit gamma/tau